uniref:Gustatory receptor n=1 Tax=Romanomermis culicivorax TaxID=13658 RepID=A0A915IZE2_ROMCU
MKTSTTYMKDFSEEWTDSLTITCLQKNKQKRSYFATRYRSALVVLFILKSGAAWERTKSESKKAAPRIEVKGQSRQRGGQGNGNFPFFITLGEIGLFMNSLSTKILIECGARIPYRIKILLIASCLTYAVRCVYFMAKCGYIICILINDGYDSTSMSYGLCVLEETFYITTGFGHFLSLFYISIERLIVSQLVENFKDRKYNGKSIKFNMAVASTFVFGACVHFLITGLSYHNFRYENLLNFCYVAFIWDKTYANTYTFLCIFVQIVTCLTHYIVHRKNRRNFDRFVVQNVHGNLDRRFNIWSNIKVTKWLLKVMVPSTILMTVVLAAILIWRTQFSLDFKWSVFYSVTVMCFYSFEAFLFSIILLRFNPSLKDFIRSNYPRLWTLIYGKKIIACIIKSGKVEPYSTTTSANRSAEKSTRISMNSCKRVTPFQVQPSEQELIVKAAWERQWKINTRRKVDQKGPRISGM